MKTLLVKWMGLQSLFAVLFLTVPSVMAKETIYISSLYYPPIIYEQEVEDMGFGIGRDIVTEAFKAAEYQPHYTILPMIQNTWSILNNKNKVNLGVTRWFENQKQAHLIDSVDIFEMRFVFFYKKQRFPNGIEFQKLTDLTGLDIGNVRGSLTTKLLKQAGLNVFYVKQIDQTIRLLASDRVDLAIAVDLSGWEIINELYPGRAHEFATIKTPVITEPLALIFRNQDQEIKRRFSSGLSQIMYDGRFTDIVHRYYSRTDIEVSEDILSKLSDTQSSKLEKQTK